MDLVSTFTARSVDKTTKLVVLQQAPDGAFAGSGHLPDVSLGGAGGKKIGDLQVSLSAPIRSRVVGTICLHETPRELVGAPLRWDSIPIRQAWSRTRRPCPQGQGPVGASGQCGRLRTPPRRSPRRCGRARRRRRSCRRAERDLCLEPVSLGTSWGAATPGRDRPPLSGARPRLDRIETSRPPTRRGPSRSSRLSSALADGCSSEAEQGTEHRRGHARLFNHPGQHAQGASDRTLGAIRCAVGAEPSTARNPKV